LKRSALALCLLCFSAGPALAACDGAWDWVQMACNRLVDTYQNGDNQLLLSGYAWHTPWTWTAEKRAEENSNAWGGGWARSIDRPDDITDTVYFLVFKDSHSNAQFNLGYSWLKYWGDRDLLQGGLGYSVFILQRPDIASGVPIPGILPVAALRHGQVQVVASDIPQLNAGVNHGSVLYVSGSIGLGK
jgi:lipid IVA palmitoyltransferase